MKFDFRPDRAAGQALHAWWLWLQKNTGDRAQIRRCRRPEEVLLEPAFHRLLHHLGMLASNSGSDITQRDTHDVYRLAAVAGLLAHIEEHHGRTLAEQMADSKGGNPVVSSLRFRRLLKQPFDDLYPAMTRVIRQLKRQASIHDLAQSVFYWGDGVRKGWALAYFSKVAS